MTTASVAFLASREAVHTLQYETGLAALEILPLNSVQQNAP